MITIYIGSVGYPTFNRCFSTINNLFANHNLVHDIVVVKDKFPTSEWLNEMKNSTTKYTLQVDEDMYLYKNAVDELFKLAESNKNTLNASSLLYDLFLKTNIGSLKLWNTEALRSATFKDVQGADRQFAKDAAKFGFKNYETKLVLGDHDSAPSPEITYFKYKEYIMKIRRFQSEKAAYHFINTLKKLNTGDLIHKLALEGAQRGLIESLDENTKNYLKNMNSNEIKEVMEKYK